MTPRRFLVATRSADKLREIRELLADAHLELVSLADLEILATPEEDAIEAFDTFRENALAKARYFLERTGMPTLADDSGLAIDALGGAPGVRSKRFSGAQLSGTALDQANNRRVLELLQGVPEEERGARYVCAAACIEHDGAARVAIGTCPGTLLEAPRGGGGFGYDPLFRPHGFDRTFGELPADVKHRLSHRGRAFRALAAALH